MRYVLPSIHRSVLRLCALAFAFGLTGAAHARPAGYEDSVQCAAAYAVAAGMLRSDDASEEDQQDAEDFETLATAWLGRAVEVGGRGQEATFADFDFASRALTAQVAAAESDDDFTQAIGGPLEICNRFDMPTSEGGSQPDGDDIV